MVGPAVFAVEADALAVLASVASALPVGRYRTGATIVTARDDQALMNEALGFKDWTSCTIDRARNVVSAVGTDAVEPMTSFNVWVNGSAVPMVVTSVMSRGLGLEWEAVDRLTFVRRYGQYCTAELGDKEDQ